MPLNLKTPERIAQALAVLCLMILILLAGKPSFTNASEPVRGIHDPAIAVQVARNAAEIDAILGPAPGADREAMRLKEYLDFALIVAYIGIAAAMAVAMKRMRPLAWVLLGCVLAAAFFDWTASLAILRLLPVDLPQTTQPMIDAIRRASAVKWSLLALAFALLAVFFFRSRRWYLRLIAVLDLAAGALAYFGISHNEWLPSAAGLLSVGLVLSAATLNVLTHESAS